MISFFFSLSPIFTFSLIWLHSRHWCERIRDWVGEWLVAWMVVNMNAFPAWMQGRTDASSVFKYFKIWKWVVWLDVSVWYFFTFMLLLLLRLVRLFRLWDDCYLVMPLWRAKGAFLNEAIKWFAILVVVVDTATIHHGITDVYIRIHWKIFNLCWQE